MSDSEDLGDLSLLAFCTPPKVRKGMTLVLRSSRRFPFSVRAWRTGARVRFEGIDHGENRCFAFV